MAKAKAKKTNKPKKTGIKKVTQLKKTSQPKKATKATKAKKAKAAPKNTKAVAKKKTQPKVKSAVKKVGKMVSKKVAKAAKIAKAPVKKVSPKVTVQPKKAGVSVSKASPFTFSPLDDRILVQLIPTEKVTAGGIIIPDSVNLDSQAYYKAKVVSVGPGHKNKKGKLRPLDLMVGDVVLFQKYAGEQLEIQGNIHFILRESEVLGVTV